MASWPSSTPMLKPARLHASVAVGSPRSASTLAKPKPWIRPKPKATIQRRPPISGRRLFAAATTTEAAIADSTQREGRVTHSSAASDSVIECAAVKAVTTATTSRSACPKRGTPIHRPSRRRNTAGSSSATRKRMWSRPIQMCHTPCSRNEPKEAAALGACAAKLGRAASGDSTAAWALPSSSSLSSPRCSVSRSNSSR